MDLYNGYKVTEIVDIENLLSELKKTENIYERAKPKSKKKHYSIYYSTGGEYMPTITLEQIKEHLGIDLDDDYNDELLEMLRDTSTDYLEYLVNGNAANLNQNLATVFILCMISELFNNRDLTKAGAVTRNNILTSIVMQLQYA